MATSQKRDTATLPRREGGRMKRDCDDFATEVTQEVEGGAIILRERENGEVSITIRRNLDKLGGCETIYLSDWTLRVISDAIGIRINDKVRVVTGVEGMRKELSHGPINAFKGGFNGW